MVYSSFDTLGDIKRIVDFSKRMSSYDASVTIILEAALKNFLQMNHQAENLVILSDAQLADVSMLLAFSKFLNEETAEYKFFEKYHISEQKIMDFFGISLPQDDFTPEKAEIANAFFKHFSEYDKDDNLFSSSQMLSILLEKKSDVVVKVIESFGVDFQVFKQECLTGIDYEDSLTIEDRCAMLNSLLVPDLPNNNSTTALLTYGSTLASHTAFINQECTELGTSYSTEAVTESISDVIGKVCEKRKVPIRKATWFESLFGVEVETVEEEVINPNAITSLKTVISDYIHPVYQDIQTLESFVKYLSAYRRKVLEYKSKTAERLTVLNAKKDSIDSDDFEELLSVSTQIRAVEAKKSGFELTDQLVKQYIYKSYLLLQNDVVTITGLEMSKNVLIPLLEAETFMGNAISNQKNGENVTQSVVKLLGEVVSHNEQGIKQGLEEIKKTGISEERLAVLNQNITAYLSQINSTESPDSIQLEKLPQLSENMSNDLDKPKNYQFMASNKT